MGDEETYASGGLMFKAGDNGEWENLGYISDSGISFASDDDDLEVWQGRLPELNKPVTVALKPMWWSLNRLYKLVYGRYRYTVASLRKEGKGHKGKRTRRAVR